MLIGGCGDKYLLSDTDHLIAFKQLCLLVPDEKGLVQRRGETSLSKCKGNTAAMPVQCEKKLTVYPEGMWATNTLCVSRENR